MLLAQNGWLLGPLGGGSGGGSTTTVKPERTRYLTADALADITVGNDGDQAIIVGGLLQGLVFETASGALTCVGQHERPSTFVIMSVSQRDLIGSILGAGQVFEYLLLEDNGVNPKGIYQIHPNGIGGGVQLGPYMVGGGSSSSSSTTGYVHNQTTPATTWTVVHGLNTLTPDVSVWVGNVLVDAPLEVIDANTLAVGPFPSAETGSVSVRT